MKTITTAKEMRVACRDLRQANKSLGFVPTMGALHEGHLSLVRAARGRCDAVAVSIFVNPTQFGPKEDFAKYPRTLEQDAKTLTAENVDLLFAPPVDEIYPSGAITAVNVDGMSERLCGRSRPGHFRGVTTVVSALFHIVEPTLAYFGQKDAAQLAIVRRMVRDLAMPVTIVSCPIIREADGLAMSSRNVFLQSAERKQALALNRALELVRLRYEQGERRAAGLVDAARQVFAEARGVIVEYVEVVHPETLEPVAEVSRGAVVAVAAKVGSTRLIDNMVLPSGK